MIKQLAEPGRDQSRGAQQDLVRTETHMNLNESLGWTRGRHYVQAGFQLPDWSRRGFFDRSDFGGTFYFGSLDAYASRQPYAFDFFRAVRLMQCHLRGKDAARPAPRLGTSKLPQDDPVRFGQKPSLAFAPSTMDSLVWPGDDPARFGTLKRDQLAENPAVPNLPKLYVNFFGLFGPNGPMPLHFTDYAIRRHHSANRSDRPDCDSGQ